MNSSSSSRFGNPNNSRLEPNDKFGSQPFSRRKNWAKNRLKDAPDDELFLKDDLDGYKTFKSFDQVDDADGLKSFPSFDQKEDTDDRKPFESSEQTDDTDGYKPFKSFDHEIKQGFSADDLMVKVKGRFPITLEFLERLEITQLNSDEESDAVKTVVKKLCDLLYDYQLSALSEDEKQIIRQRGVLKA